LFLGPLLYHMFLVDMRIGFASPSWNIARFSRGRKRGRPAQFGSDGSQPSANLPVEVGGQCSAPDASCPPAG
jgi:hypothetical protein